MRSATAAELALLAADHFAYHVRLLVLDSEDIWRNISGSEHWVDLDGTKMTVATSTQGLDWLKGYELDFDNDLPMAQARFSVRRDVNYSGTPAGLSLSPLRQDSVANRKADGTTFQSIVDVGRYVRFDVAATKRGFFANSRLETDGGLEAGTGAAWSLGTNWTVQNTNARTGTWALKHVSGGISPHVATNLSTIPVNEGDQLYAEGYMKGTGGADGTVALEIAWYDAAMVLLASSASGAPASDGAYHLLTVLDVAPATAAFARVRIVILTQTTGIWYADDLMLLWGQWHRLFEGNIDTVDLASDPMTVTARDLGFELQNFLPDAPSAPPITMPADLEDVIQSVLDWELGVFGPTLYTPVSPAYAVDDFSYKIESLHDIIHNLADVIGWDLRYKWDDGTDAFRLTLSDPDRGKTTPDHTIGSDQYVSVDTFALDRTNLRNRIRINYRDSTTGNREDVVALDATSINNVGEQRMVILEPDPPHSAIITNTAATDLASVILHDLKDPRADVSVTMLPFWPAELRDLYRFAANARHFSTDQDLAVMTLRHTGDVSEEGQATHRTIVDLRGSVAGQYLQWRVRAIRSLRNQ